MPNTIDEVKMRKRATFDVSRPTDPATGIPMKNIPILEYPRVVYKHPNRPFRTIEHRNAQHEVVDVETIATEHLTRVVHDKTEFDQAIKEGWVTKPYIPQAPPVVEDDLYDSKPKAAK